ncbi:hypothetical protein BKA70DRAFT_785950 [Coprinopsis sp. MPI-PUGE-AT-0042]|nr:hypothetical protein BKA70DRAFT_785950 [Coprinopsis sp. MPI-PUGE-AT-0042]
MPSECQPALLAFISPQALSAPKRVTECIERRLSVSTHCSRPFGEPAPFPQCIPDSLFPSGETVTAILPNHLLDDITGSGSLTNPSHIHQRQRRTLKRRKGSSSLLSKLWFSESSRTLERSPNSTCIYPLVSIANRSLFEGLNPSLSFTSARPADPRFYQGEIWTGLREWHPYPPLLSPRQGYTDDELSYRAFSLSS